MSCGEWPPSAEKLLDRLSFGAGMAVACDDMLGRCWLFLESVLLFAPQRLMLEADRGRRG